MKYSVEKILNNNRVVGYRTVGLNTNFIINLPISPKTAASIFDEVLKIKELPNIITEIANVDIHVIKNESDIILILPDENGKYPSDSDCNELFRKQIRGVS